MLIRNPAIPMMDKVIEEIEAKIESLEMKESLSDEQKEELKNLKHSHAVKSFFRIGEILVKEAKNPVHLVVTNPTHFGVALHFTQDNQTICLAKGVDKSALMIMQQALASKVKVVEFKEVARDIYANAKIYEPLENHRIHILGELDRDMSLFDAIELAKINDKLVSKEFVQKALSEKSWEE
jgi:flagellar biosynthesis protein FlhB